MPTSAQIETVKRYLRMQNTDNFDSVLAYMRAGGKLTGWKEETGAWGKFLKANGIAEARDNRARRIFKHWDEILRKQGSIAGLEDAIHVCQEIEDGVHAKAVDATPAEAPAPKRMGRPRKSDAAKWETQFRNLLGKAPAGVTCQIDGRTVTVALGE